MYEIKRFDGEGNLIEVISAEKCWKTFWSEFGAPKIPTHQLETRVNVRGISHLIKKVNRALPFRQCRYCKRMFQPPKHKKATLYCYQPALGEMQQCRRLAKRERVLKKPVEVMCAVCNTPFMTPKSNAKFCRDPKCNRNALAVRKNAGGRFVNCHHCGIKFKARHTGNQKYCVMPYFVRNLQCVTLATEERKRDKLS